MKRYEPFLPILAIEYIQFDVDQKLNEHQIGIAEVTLNRKLPSSFRDWLIEIGDGAATLSTQPVIHNLLGEPTTEPIEHALTIYRQYGWNIDPDILIFAHSGRDSYWAFDTTLIRDGEWPVIEVHFDDLGGEGKKYLLGFTSFERFIWSEVLYNACIYHPEYANLDEETEVIMSIRKLIDPEVNRISVDIYEYRDTIESIRLCLRDMGYV